MKAELISVDQNFQEENTIIWFDVSGTYKARSYGVCFESQPSAGYSVDLKNGFHAKMLDCDGCPEAIERSEGFHIWNKILPLAIEEFESN
mgnify:CR=1 FL=1